MNRSDVTLIRIYINNNLYKEVKPENNGCFSVELENITPSDQIKIEYLTSDGKVEKETLEGKKLLNLKKSKNKFDYSVSFGVDTKNREPQTRIDLNFHPDSDNDIFTSYTIRKKKLESYNIRYLHRFSKTKKLQISFNGQILNTTFFGTFKEKKINRDFSFSFTRDFKNLTNTYNFLGGLSAKDWRAKFSIKIPPPPQRRKEYFSISKKFLNFSLGASFQFLQEKFSSSSYTISFGSSLLGNITTTYSTDFYKYKNLYLSWNKWITDYNLGWYAAYNTNLKGDYSYSLNFSKGFKWFNLSLGLKKDPFTGFTYSISLNGYFYWFGRHFFLTSRSVNSCVALYGIYKGHTITPGVYSKDEFAQKGVICGLNPKKGKHVNLIPVQYKQLTLYPSLDEVVVYQIQWEFNTIEIPYEAKVPTLIEVSIKGKSFAGLKVYIDKQIKFTDLSGEIFTYLTEGTHKFCIDKKLAKNFSVKNRCIKVKITKQDLLMGGKELILDFN